MTLRNLLCSTVLLFLFVSIGCRDSGPESKVSGLQNILWTLQSFETIGGITDTIADGRTYSILFVSDTTARVRADCNDCTGTYYASPVGMDAHISVGNFFCTKVYCGSQSLDMKFLGALGSASDYVIQGNVLRVYYNERRQALNFTRGF